MDGHSILNSKLSTYAVIVFGCDGGEGGDTRICGVLFCYMLDSDSFHLKHRKKNKFSEFYVAYRAFSCIQCQMPDCWLEVSIRKVLRPATSTQVFLGFPMSTSEC